MTEICAGLQTMRSFILWSSCDRRVQTPMRSVLWHRSACRGNMTSRFLAYVSLLSVLHTWWVSNCFWNIKTKQRCVAFQARWIKWALQTSVAWNFICKFIWCDASAEHTPWLHLFFPTTSSFFFVSFFLSFFLPLYLCSSLTIEYEEDYEDVTVNQMLAPKSQDTDTTEILNNLLKEYDKKLRPDIGGNSLFMHRLWKVFFHLNVQDVNQWCHYM